MSRFLALAALGLLTPAVACGQTATPPPAPSTEVPQQRSDAPTSPLSEQLSRSGGVIRPPDNVDRKIEAPTPSAGAQSMPIIPPPGTPGGNPDVKPK